MGNDEAIMLEADRLVIPILLICIQQLIHTHFEFLRNQAFGHPKIDSLCPLPLQDGLPTLDILIII